MKISGKEWRAKTLCEKLIILHEASRANKKRWAGEI